MDFEKNVPEWNAKGTEPPASLKESGFEAGYKPPAAFFNWFFNGVSACLKEIREKLSGHAGNKENPHNVTLSQLGAASSTHKHAASDITSGTLPINRGGTGATDADTARSNIGAAPASHNHSASSITSGILPVARGGTGSNVVDETPTENSKNMVTSGGVYAALSGTVASGHKHNASDITSGTLGVLRGGTGITSNPSMLINLGSTNAASVFATSPRPGVTGTLPIANGGTGATDAETARVNLEITPANIGAANASHNHSASNITSGTMSIARGGTGATSASAARTSLGITPANIGAQPALGFTPVSQGTGTGQGGNKVHIGWATDGTGLKVAVDSTDLGYIYTSAKGKGVPVTSVNGETGAVKVKRLYGANGEYAMLQTDGAGAYIFSVVDSANRPIWAIQGTTKSPNILSHHCYNNGTWQIAGNIYSTVNKPSAADIGALSRGDGVIVSTTVASPGEIATGGYKSQNTVAATAIAGYKPVAILNVSSDNSSWVFPYAYWLNGNTIVYSVRNLSTVAVNTTLTIRCLYVQE